MPIKYSLKVLRYSKYELSESVGPVGKLPDG